MIPRLDESYLKASPTDALRRRMSGAGGEGEEGGGASRCRGGAGAAMVLEVGAGGVSLNARWRNDASLGAQTYVRLTWKQKHWKSKKNYEGFSEPFSPFVFRVRPW